MRGVGIDWTGQVAKAARASKRRMPEWHGAEDDDDGDDESLLPYSLTTVIWLVIAVAVLFWGGKSGWAGTLLILAVLKMRHDHHHEVDDEEVYYAPVAPVTYAAQIPAIAFDTVSYSVYQGAEGPTVSIITNDGEIFTKVCPSWGSASAYIARTKAKYEADGITVKFLTEPV